MYFDIHFFCLLLCSSSFDFPENPSFVEIFFHRFGKIVIIPRATNTPPENDFQNDGGTSISIVLAFNKREKRIIEILNDQIITKGIFLFSPSSALAHKTIGSRGKTQGAKTVNIPDKNAITKSVIPIFINY
jgi:hypothetical protein